MKVDKEFVRLMSLHLAALAVVWTGVSPLAFFVMVFFYCWRGLFQSVGYHRYFSHRSFKTSRLFQAILAFGGCLCMQRGALWWAASHRRHHQYSDTDQDLHSPVTHSFWYSHMGWALKESSFHMDYSRVKDFERYPELKILNEYNYLVHLSFAVILFFLGELLKVNYPAYETSGTQLVVWGYVIGALLHLHSIFLVNSWCHRFGKRPYDMDGRKDNSQNVAWLALLNFGEGWHYNHHNFPSSAKSGLLPYQIDGAWIAIKFLEKLGIVWDVKLPTKESLLQMSRRESIPL